MARIRCRTDNQGHHLFGKLELLGNLTAVMEMSGKCQRKILSGEIVVANFTFTVAPVLS